LTRFFEGSLRFFYGATLGGKEIAQQIPFARKEDTLPAVLSREQVMQLLRTEPACRGQSWRWRISSASLVRRRCHDVFRERFSLLSDMMHNKRQRLGGKQPCASYQSSAS